jgi:ABC-type lipoprotein export system ATPase subunit
MEQQLFTLPLREFIRLHPVSRDFLKSYGLHGLDPDLPFPDAVGNASPASLRELGLGPLELSDLLIALLDRSDAEQSEKIGSIEIFGGSDKDGLPEKIVLRFEAGEAVSIVGPTGSGKSQLLADIESAARGDTPSRRHVRFDGEELSEEKRFTLGSRLVAHLTQNMNFVIDVSVEDFLRMHAGSRQLADADTLIRECFDMANRLSGETFGLQTKLTRLSGGQARALMIADAACISPSPVLLIDEIENAGIDRIRAVELLTGGDKIVLLATHDPLLALSAARRVVLHNGGIRAVLDTDDEEKEMLRKLIEADRINTKLRRAIRAGERIESICGNCMTN